MYDTIPHYALKFLRRKVYLKFFKPHQLPPLECEEDLDKANQMIYNLLVSDKPCMIGRFGAFEMSVCTNYHFIKQGRQSILKYIQGEGGEWWWNEHTLSQMTSNAGFWPATHKNAEKFAECYIDGSRNIDVLGSWIQSEAYFDKELSNATKVHLFALEPFFSNYPWTRALKDKKVLIIHPFIETIKSQYLKRDHLFVNKEILPSFDILLYKSIQSIGGNSNYSDWFEALDKMKKDIDMINFDIAVVGCGAYGLPLAAHIKRTGRKSVHMGGVTQILFGIRGARWEKPVPTMCKYGYYPDLMNEYWVRPGDDEKPKTANKVEGGCYW